VAEYRASLAALGFPVAAAEPEIAPLRDDAWASAWQQSFRPRAVGKRLLVVPPWVAAAARAAGRIAIVIEPGRAFGTGHHGSTEGCLALLDEHADDIADATLLDIGTGTGILAVAALKLGAARAVAVDVDPDAVAAARANAARNGCAERFSVLVGGPEALDGARFPLVLANLLGHTHLALAPVYPRLTAPGGRLILGGILADEDARVVDALAAAGFALERRLVLEGWSSLLLSAR
jgi:ribosomal protein L11 methyltransferase